ncbi:MAG: tyrosine protein kinase, partial [Tannerellaceae bacterium]|nr:tyrosine protein kinase [Tannerellaceae bacterium]
MNTQIKDSEVIGLKSIIVKYLFHWKLFLAVFAISFLPAIAYLIWYPRTYEIMARIQVMEE